MVRWRDGEPYRTHSAEPIPKNPDATPIMPDLDESCRTPWLLLAWCRTFFSTNLGNLHDHRSRIQIHQNIPNSPRAISLASLNLNRQVSTLHPLSLTSTPPSLQTSHTLSPKSSNYRPTYTLSLVRHLLPHLISAFTTANATMVMLKPEAWKHGSMKTTASRTWSILLQQRPIWLCDQWSPLHMPITLLTYHYLAQECSHYCSSGGSYFSYWHILPILAFAPVDDLIIRHVNSTAMPCIHLDSQSCIYSRTTNHSPPYFTRLPRQDMAKPMGLNHGQRTSNGFFK